jgi:hypothetical protein
MESNVLLKITNYLENTLKELTKLGIVDSKLRSKYAEYLVAYELAKRGHDVQLSNERENTNADIYIADKQKRVEVKSGKYDEEGWTDASFGDGKQISRNKFDYCVFVTFDESDESKVNEIFIFTREELEEVAKPRKGIAAHPKTNPCLLLRCRNFNEYEEEYVKTHKSLKIEVDLNKYPKKYDQAWTKIK